ncbi:MAG TPA: TetR/AcrR family transcriptional regulator [Terriglobia bacterium]|nr:TetR/AcrR family transcriptional regulator [Terriglobia bacterium]
MTPQAASSGPATHPTRGKLVEAARRLFWERGYEATSLQDVVLRARVRSGSLYYFFRTKEDLLLAVLDHYVDLLWPAVIEPAFGRTADPIERIFSILNGYREGLVYTGFTHGCPIGNLALEVSDDYPRAREKIARNFDGWRKWIRKCLEEAVDRLPAGTDSERMAMFVLSLMEGAVMQARAHHSLEPFDASVAELRQYFNRLLGEGARERAPKVH